jgi:FtsZ-binding cell division protein ZapB
MKNIGFVEKTDNEKTQMIKFLVDSAKGINTSKINKEVSPMTEDTNTVAEVIETEAVAEVTKSEVAPEADAKADAVETASEEETTEKAEKPKTDEENSEEDAETPADAKDTEDKKPMASKSDDVVVDSIAEIKNTLTSAFSDLVATVKSLQAEVEMLKSTKVDLEAAKNSFDAVAKDIAAVKEEYNEFGKRVDAVEADTAFRKSGDLGEIVQDQPEMVEKSLWGGSFLKTADLFK